MAKHRTHGIAFKRRVVQEYLAGETLHGLARRQELSRTLIRIRVEKYEAGAFDEDALVEATQSSIPRPTNQRNRRLNSSGSISWRSERIE